MRYPAEYVPPALDNVRRRSSAHRVSYRLGFCFVAFRLCFMYTLKTEDSYKKIS